MVQAGFPTGQRGQTDEALALGSVFHMGLSCPSVTLGHLSCCPPRHGRLSPALGSGMYRFLVGRGIVLSHPVLCPAPGNRDKRRQAWGDSVSPASLPTVMEWQAQPQGCVQGKMPYPPLPCFMASVPVPQGAMNTLQSRVPVTEVLKGQHSGCDTPGEKLLGTPHRAPSESA